MSSRRTAQLTSNTKARMRCDALMNADEEVSYE